MGFTARCLACYGLSDLRIVGRAGIAASEGTRKTASGGEAVLAGARDFSDLPSALADCHMALAFSRRARDPAQRIVDLPETPSLLAASEKVALVFGCESQGLSHEDTLHCSHVVRIPLVSETLSLNLSHAVAIALASLRGTGGAAAARATASGAAPTGLAGPREIPARDPATPAASAAATLGDSEKLLAETLSLLARKGAFRPAKAEAQADYLRILWQRLRPTRAELEFLAGVLKKLGG